MSSKTAKTAVEFAPSAAILKRARKILAGYTVTIRPSDSGRFIGSAAELPGVIGSGATFEECGRRVKFALETVIASYLVDGETPPASIDREKRTEQVNVRFTPSERDRLAQESARKGFRGVGDLIRAEMIRQIDSKWR